MNFEVSKCFEIQYKTALFEFNGKDRHSLFFLFLEPLIGQLLSRLCIAGNKTNHEMKLEFPVIFQMNRYLQ